MVFTLSNKILSLYNLSKLVDSTTTELKKIKGIGPTKSSQILAIIELSKRISL
jgi:DNA repair protein RadC